MSPRRSPKKAFHCWRILQRRLDIYNKGYTVRPMTAIRNYVGNRRTFYTTSRLTINDRRNSLLKNRRVCAIINVALDEYPNNTGIPTFHIPIEETSNWGRTPFIRITRIIKSLPTNRPILFHCKAGISRSVTVATIFSKALNDTVRLPSRKVIQRYDNNCRRGRVPTNIIVEIQKLLRNA